MKSPECIVCAAILLDDGVILCGARHWDSVMRKQMKAMGNDRYVGEQGFINQFGEFRTREQALVIVKSNGQPFNAERNGSETELFSEGLY
jgi:hypothetical protein